jgi:protein-L-isoaspartate(D-aspartate) O-methyltransferase
MTVTDDSGSAARRAQMVDLQIARRGILDARVLAAMRQVPRHLFVPPAQAEQAYDDRALPIGEGQTISQPYMVGIMTAALELRSTDRILEIGTGSGYQAAILSILAREVVTVERRSDLAAVAAARLAELGYDNVQVVVADGSAGYAAGAPYDAILVTAAAPSVPSPLKAQLADGGRLVVPVGPRDLQKLKLVRRVGSDYVEREGEGCVFVPLLGEHGFP